MKHALLRMTLLVAAPTALFVATPTAAAPIQTQATLTVSFGFGSAPVVIAGSGTVDVVESTIRVPAGLVSLGSPVVVPVTASTVINIFGFHEFHLEQLSNLAGTFSIGGVEAQLPGEVCPAGLVPGQACNVGGGIDQAHGRHEVAGG